MADTIIEIADENVNRDAQTIRFQKIETKATDSSITSNLSSLKLGSSVIGIFGYTFKGPEKFGSISKAERLNSEIFCFIDRSARGLHPRSHGSTQVSKSTHRHSLGGASGFNDMSKFPMKFKHGSLEDLYSLNLNDWIMKRMLFISPMNLIITVLFWLLTATAFEKTGAWRDDQYIQVLFHSIMGITVLLIFAPLLCTLKNFNHLAEKMCYATLGMMGFLWGCWQLMGSYTLRGSHLKASIFEVITSREALKGVTYIYGLLPIVSIDSILPTRSSRTWWIHLQFIFFYSISTITTSYINSYMPWAYVVFRITFFVSIIFLLYFGSFNSEVQTRISFYNWLVNTKKIAKLETDISGLKSPTKFSTPAEVLLVNVKKCLRIARYIEDAFKDRIPEISDSMGQLCKTMKTCRDQLTMSPNLYSFPEAHFKSLGEGGDILQSYITSYYEPHALKPLSVDGSARSEVPEEPALASQNTRLSSYLKPPSKSDSRVNLFQILNDWNFDVIGHFRDEAEPFLSLGFSMLSQFQKHYNVPEDTICNFLNVVQGLYKNVAYHNSMHSAFVAQKVCCLANFIGVYDTMSVLDKAVLVVASLCHDIGHPGRTNSFYINAGHDVALLFNDKSVLENFHCCLTFNVLRMAECNIFGFLDREGMRQVRHRIIELILATDMEDHFETISRFRLRRTSHDFSCETDCGILYKMLIKTADIASTCLSWDLSYEWTQRIFLEFYSQGELEKTLDMPVSALCDSNRHRDVPKAQVGFLRFVSSPLFEELSKIPREFTSYLVLKHTRHRDDDPNSGCPACLKSRSLFSLTDCNSPHGEMHVVHGEHPGADGESDSGASASSGNANSAFGHEPGLCEHHCRTSVANPVYSICIAQLKANAERWDQMADLGEIMPIPPYPHEQVELDITFAINV